MSLWYSMTSARTLFLRHHFGRNAALSRPIGRRWHRVPPPQSGVSVRAAGDRLPIVGVDPRRAILAVRQWRGLPPPISDRSGDRDRLRARGGWRRCRRDGARDRRRAEDRHGLSIGAAPDRYQQRCWRAQRSRGPDQGRPDQRHPVAGVRARLPHRRWCPTS